LEGEATGVHGLIDRRKLEELESSPRRANSKAEAAAAAFQPPSPAVTFDMLQAFLQSEEGRALVKSSVEAAQAKQAEEAANAMHESAFARFAAAASLPPDVAAKAKEL